MSIENGTPKWMKWVLGSVFAVVLVMGSLSFMMGADEPSYNQNNSATVPSGNSW